MSLPLVPAACLWCDAELPHAAAQDCPGCGRALRPLDLDATTLRRLAEVLRARDAVAVVAATPDGLRFTLVAPGGDVTTTSAPSGQGMEVRPVDRPVDRLVRRLGLTRVGA